MLLCQDMQLYSFTVNVRDSLHFTAALLTCAVFWPGVFWHFQVKTTGFTQVRHFLSDLEELEELFFCLEAVLSFLPPKT